MKIELTGVTKYYYVFDEENNREYTIIEMLDTNTNSCSYEVIDCSSDEKLSNEDEVINKFLNSRK